MKERKAVMCLRIINVDPEMHRQFKTLVTAEESNVSAKIRELMAEYITKKGGKK